MEVLYSTGMHIPTQQTPWIHQWLLYLCLSVNRITLKLWMDFREILGTVTVVLVVDSSWLWTCIPSRVSVSSSALCWHGSTNVIMAMRGLPTAWMDSIMEFDLKQVADRFELSQQAWFKLVHDLVCHKLAGGRRPEQSCQKPGIHALCHLHNLLTGHVAQMVTLPLELTYGIWGDFWQALACLEALCGSWSCKCLSKKKVTNLWSAQIRIGRLHFQAGCHMKRLNLALVFFVFI